MAISDVDTEQLISRFCGALAPSDRAAFRAAAEDALTRVPCLGEGAIYRAVAALQRIYFHPPPDTRATSTGARGPRMREVLRAGWRNGGGHRRDGVLGCRTVRAAP